MTEGGTDGEESRPRRAPPAFKESPLVGLQDSDEAIDFASMNGGEPLTSPISVVDTKHFPSPAERPSLGDGTFLPARPALSSQRNYPSPFGRRERARVVRIEPWDFLWFSSIFFGSIAAAFVCAGLLVFLTADAAGVVGNLEGFVRQVGWPYFEIKLGAVLGWLLGFGALMVFLLSAGGTLLVLLYNLIALHLGGVEVILRRDS